MEVLGLDTSEVAAGSLGSSNGPKLGDKVFLRGLFHGSILVTISMCYMLKVERAGNAVFEVMHCAG